MPLVDVVTADGTAVDQRGETAVVAVDEGPQPFAFLS